MFEWPGRTDSGTNLVQALSRTPLDCENSYLVGTLVWGEDM